jgi:transposase InsO family protein
MAILRHSEAFTQGKNRTSALKRFCTLYASGEVPVDQQVYETVPSVSVATLYNWQRAFKDKGKAGLAPRYGKRSAQTYKTHWDEHPQQREVVSGFIHKHGKNVKASHIWRELKVRFGEDAIPSRRTVARYVKQWFERHPQLADQLTDPNSWKGKHRVSVGRRDEAVRRLAQVWEIDTTPADLLLKYERPDGSTGMKRYAVLGIIEVYSRTAALRVVPVENTHAVLSTLRHTILRWQRFPETIRTDQGAVYTSKHFQQILDDLGIQADILPPGRPELKPYIERFLGTFNRDIVPQLPGYAGSNVGQRRQIEARKKGLERSGLTEKESTLELALTQADFQLICDNWLREYNGSRIHRSLQCTPDQKVAQWLDKGLSVRGIPTERKDEYEALLAMLLAPAPKTRGKAPGVRVVRKGKVSVEGIDYAAPEFGEEWNGREVVCRYDEADVSRIFVYDLSMRFVCIAFGLGIPGGISRQEAQKRSRKAQSAYMKRMRAASREVLRNYNPQRVARFLTEDPSTENTQAIDVEERLTPTMEEARRAAKEVEREMQPRRLKSENDHSIRDRIADHERRIREREEFKRPNTWSSRHARYAWCCEAESTGHTHLMTDSDHDFCKSYISDLGV